MKDQKTSPSNKDIYLICGVSGSGKSTIGKALSEKVGLPFYDGDDFHPEENVVKMKSGMPLNDDDRKGWLQAINQFIQHLKPAPLKNGAELWKYLNGYVINVY